MARASPTRPSVVGRRPIALCLECEIHDPPLDTSPGSGPSDAGDIRRAARVARETRLLRHTRRVLSVPIGPGSGARRVLTCVRWLLLPANRPGRSQGAGGAAVLVDAEARAGVPGGGSCICS